MAQDLSFWKYKSEAAFDDEKVYTKLSLGMKVDEVEELPINKIYEDIRIAFAQWNWISKNNFENNEETIELFITKQFIRFECYSITIENMNRIIDIMNKYGCPLYDSAISTRFSL